MRVSARSLGSVLAEIAGADRVSDDPAVLAAASVDGQTPRWVVTPVRLEALAGVVALAYEESLAVIVRGSGSALDCGGPPARVDLVIDMRRLDRVLDDQPDDLTVTVEAGITGGALAARLNARRQWLPLDPPGWRGRTLGGMMATRASGPLRARYGTARDLLLGVRFVQADGVVTWGGARVVKSVSGYDVPKLMVGALGTLGVLAEMTLRLHPMPETEGTWLAAFDTPEAAGDFVARLVDSTVQPSRVEYLNAPALRALEAGDAGAAVAVAIGSVAPAVREQGEQVEAFGRAAGGRVAPVREDFWGRYDSAFSRAAGETVLAIGALPARLADTVRAVERAIAPLSAAPAALLTGAATAGAFRLALLGEEPAAVARALEALREYAADQDGHVVVEGAPAELRAAVDPWGPVEPTALNLMRALKDEFDPRRVLNPGRFVGGL